MFDFDSYSTEEIRDILFLRIKNLRKEKMLSAQRTEQQQWFMQLSIIAKIGAKFTILSNMEITLMKNVTLILLVALMSNYLIQKGFGQNGSLGLGNV